MTCDRNERLKKTIRELKKYAEANGWPSQNQWNAYAKKNDLYTTMGIYYITKLSWDSFRQSLNIPPRNKTFSKENCIQALKKAAEEYGIFIKRSEYTEWQKRHRDMPTAAQISRRCGGFNTAKELAGLVPNEAVGRTINDEEIRKALTDCARDLGRTKFSEAEYLEWRQNQDIERPHIETIRVRLGGFLPEAKKKLDLDTYHAGPQEKYNETNWLPAVIKFVEEALKLENYEKWLQENSGPSLTVLRRFAGGYKGALKEALSRFIH
jgi:hypothetical protein